MVHSEAHKEYVWEPYYDDKRLFELLKNYLWAILADQGYQGACDLFRVLIPIRESIRGASTATQLEFNQEI